MINTDEKQAAEGMTQEKEFSTLYLTYYPTVYRYLYSIAGNTSLSEDIAQDTFLEAWKNMDMLLSHPNPAGWLMRTACFKLRNFGRKANRLSLLPLTEDMPQHSSQDFSYALSELTLLLDSALSEEERLLFKHYYLLGRTVPELAALMKLTENNVRVRLSRITKKLREA